MRTRLRKRDGDNFVISEMKNIFYDAHSKTVIKNRLKICLGGNPVVMSNEIYDGF